MIQSNLNVILTVSAGVCLIQIWVLLRQKIRMPAISILAYLLFLILLDILLVIWSSYSLDSTDLSLILSARTIIHLFIPPILIYFCQFFTFSRNFPGPTTLHGSLLAAAFFLSIIVYFFPTWSFAGVALVPILVGFYTVIVFGLLAVTLKKRFATEMGHETGKSDAKWLSTFTYLTLGLLVAIILFAQIRSFDLISSILFAALAIGVLTSLLRFRLVEFDEKLRYLIPQIAVSTFFVIIFYATFDQAYGVATVYLGIVAFVAVTYLGYYLQLFSKSLFTDARERYNQDLDTKLEAFSSHIGRLMNADELWAYLAGFFSETFGLAQCVILKITYDVVPYQLEHIEGFRAFEIRSLIAEPDGPLLRELAEKQQLISRFDFTPDDELYKQMESHHIYILMPVMHQKELIGVIILGDDRQYARIPRRHLQMFNIIAAQLAVAFENIRTVETIVQSKKLASIGMLSSQLAHDFRSFISLVKLQNKENSRLIRHAAYMEKMVQDLLNYARPQELKRSNVNINQLIDMSLDLISVPSDVTVEKQFGDDLPPVELDANQMRRVFGNLIDNGFKALTLNGGSRLKISTRMIRPQSAVNPTPWIYIEFLDDGVGIPEEFQHRIFDPFFTTYKKQGGNGLGLAIVRQIIERHSGHIEVSSKSGKGTAFNIRLPIEPQQLEG